MFRFAPVGVLFTVGAIRQPWAERILTLVLHQSRTKVFAMVRCRQMLFNEGALCLVGDVHGYSFS